MEPHHPSQPSPSPSPSPGEARRPNGISASPPPIRPKAGSPSFFGKHRMAAAISYLQNQITIIQEELDQLDTLGESSTVCKEITASVESIPDPLLPVTKGPADVGWDRWFGGAHNPRNHKRWI